MSESPKSLVEMHGISKSFGPVRALEKVDLTVYEREVVGLVGDNGAGKSTLMKILTGAYQPDAGQILFQGHPVHFTSPHESRAAGIEMVYQDLALAGNLTVAANIFLGREPIKRTWGLFDFMDEARIATSAKSLLQRLKIEIRSVQLRVENLSGGQRQAIAIARATAFNARLVIMDEPTAALAVKEVAKVLDLVQSLRGHGVSVILISHRLQDVFAVCDRIVVLYEGTVAGNLLTSTTTMDEIVSRMVGSRGGLGEARAAASAG